MKPTLREEKKLWSRGYNVAACLDEAGRGSLAGPVIAAAVVATPNSKFQITNYKQIPNHKSKILNVKDSKKLSRGQREKLYKILTNHASIQWGIGVVSEKMIDKINIKNAAELAMEKALRQLENKMKRKADFLIIDGNHIKNLKLKTYNGKLMPKADEKVFSCAAASIIAKVTRDRMIMQLHKKYPHYGFNRHKGYATKYHMEMLTRYGPSKIHRISFGPIASFLQRQGKTCAPRHKISQNITK